MEIKLVRHCETEWNRLEKCQGVSDIRLNANGIYQSNLLKECFSNLNIDLIFSSDLLRAIQTSEAINNSSTRNIEKSKKLREMDQGDFEGLTFSFLRENHGDDLKSWRENPKDFRIPNGETLGEVQSRMINFIEDVVNNFHKLKNIVIVSHNLAISSLICYYLKKDLRDFATFKIDSASISTLIYEDEKIKVLELNNTEHLKK